MASAEGILVPILGGGGGSSSGVADPTVSFDLNLMVNSLPAGITFSRASAATDIISGVLTNFASGAARISSANGLRIEGQRTNLVKYNSSVATAGTLTGGQIGPDGGSLGYIYTEGTGSSGWQWSTGASTISFVSGTTYTASAFVKAGTCDRIQLFVSSSVITTYDGYANYYLNGAGSVSQLGAGFTSAGIQRLGSTDWYRVRATFTANGTASHTLAFCTLSSGTELRAGNVVGSSRNIYWFGPQLEAAATMSSYIPTTTAAVTRAADVAYYGLASTLAASTGGATLYAEAVLPYYARSVLTGRIISTRTTATSGDAHTISRVTFDDKINTSSQIAFVGQADIYPTATPAAAETVKVAYSVLGNSFQGACNGTASAVDSSGTCADIDRVYLGSTGVPDGHLFSYIKRATLYNVAKTQGELITRTA